MTENKYITTTLPNGLRIAALRTDSDVSYIGAMVNAGSRWEAPDEWGLAHFVEHTIFKGTLSRKSAYISNRMESIGGELNAYTTKEETMIYTNAPRGYADRSLALLSDLIINASFPEAEVEREREVIIEEINSYKDSPADSVFDDFEDLIYEGSGLAHNILGTIESVRGLTPQMARGFIERCYTPQNMVIYCCDPGDPDKNIRLIEKYFGGITRPFQRPEMQTPPIPLPFAKTDETDNHQANCVIGARVFGRTDSRRHALFLLNNYLGGPCMNSRLNMEMRDRRGLVYTVESNVALMSDTGLWTTYFGTDPSKAKKCFEIVKRELDRLAQAPLSHRKFAAIRDQYCGQLIMSGEHKESRAMSLAKSISYFGEIHDVHHTTNCIRALSPTDLQEAAQLILSNGLSSLTFK